MIKEIPKPGWFNSGGTITVSSVEHWFDQHIEPLNQMLRDGLEVSFRQDESGGRYFEDLNRNDTHKAYLIGIEPLKKETREERLEAAITELLNVSIAFSECSSPYISAIEKCKAALANEGE